MPHPRRDHPDRPSGTISARERIFNRVQRRRARSTIRVPASTVCLDQRSLRMASPPGVFSMRTRALCLFVLASGVVATSCTSRRADDTAASPQEIFERRIVPIFKSPNPSSCTQCHLAGVDLKDYILPSHEKTFLSLRDQGLI